MSYIFHRWHFNYSRQKHNITVWYLSFICDEIVQDTLLYMRLGIIYQSNTLFLASKNIFLIPCSFSASHFSIIQCTFGFLWCTYFTLWHKDRQSFKSFRRLVLNLIRFSTFLIYRFTIYSPCQNEALPLDFMIFTIINPIQGSIVAQGRKLLNNMCDMIVSGKN